MPNHAVSSARRGDFCEHGNDRRYHCCECSIERNVKLEKQIDEMKEMISNLAVMVKTQENWWPYGLDWGYVNKCQERINGEDNK